ncbi:hypothetical protein Y032_0085g1874 [Ancylostoma ceylanicum]|uniref:Uncharacterized protein n=1 Tax=Ancylostoma ceylanicum TaxID=53326 RepID=A0A016TQ96_9BILA|nr:hypothetical protein Y032_0085g1874 [Ancylostoma ceylanicum]
MKPTSNISIALIRNEKESTRTNETVVTTTSKEFTNAEEPQQPLALTISAAPINGSAPGGKFHRRLTAIAYFK